METGLSGRLTAISKFLSSSLVWAIPVSMIAGFALGVSFDLEPLKAAVLPLTMLMVYPMLINVRIREALGPADTRLVAVAMALNFTVLPVFAWLLARAFFASDAGLFVGMVLAGLFPTSGMTISWTGFAKGNVTAAVKMTVIGLIAASLAAPVYLEVFAGQVVSVDLLGIASTIMLVVAVPMIAAQFTRAVLVKRYGKERFATRIAPVFPGVSVIGVLGIVFVAVGLQAGMIAGRPALAALILAPLIIFYAANFALSTLVGRLLFGRADAIALVYGTAMRNLSIALGIAIASFGPEAALVLAVGYVVQVQAAAWYVRLTGKVFGAPDEAAAPSRPA
ncbi:MAG: arsenic resistance protein [Clostridiales bacterium]|nr:arsenic resistance protein [Clostridiales bacterium]